MLVGIPREIKEDEYRVALLPVGAEELTLAGHQVLVERDAGVGSGIPNELYVENGAKIVESAEEIYREADLIVKVKDAAAGGVAAAATRTVTVHIFSFCGRRRADAERARNGRDGDCLRDASRPKRRLALFDTDE